MVSVCHLHTDGRVRGVVNQLKVGFRIEVEERLVRVDVYTARCQGEVGDDRVDGTFVLSIDVVISRGKHHVPSNQVGVLSHLGAEERVAKHIQRDSCGHVIATGSDKKVQELPVGAEY